MGCVDDRSQREVKVLKSGLSLTDLFSGWTECVPLLVRDSALVIEAVDALRGSLPFMLRGLDVDNGSEFLNDALMRYCATQGIEFTRSRPYHKNDQAWIEQKNGAVVRRLVGYRRFEGMAADEALSRLYAASRLFVNFFQPSFKLKEKRHLGSRVISVTTRQKRRARDCLPRARSPSR
jgi:hypothetical protein